MKRLYYIPRRTNPLAACLQWVAAGLMALSSAHGLDYNVPFEKVNIAPTAATEAASKTEVYGQPRVSQGHPCTLWDKEDVEEHKRLIQTNEEAKAAFAKLRARCDSRLQKPLDVPVPRQGPDGQWMWPGDFPENEAPYKHLARNSERNSGDMAALGVLYNLTGDEKYAEYCKKLLLAYADAYANYGHTPGWTKNKYRSANDGRLTHQFLNDGFWLMAASFGYDLVYSLPSWTAEERKKVHADLLRAVAAEFVDPVLGKPDYLSSLHNRSAICAAATLIAGYATEDQEMVNNGAYGTGGTKEMPVGGLVGLHYTEACLFADGLWLEGAPAYQVGIASCALFNGAEVLWRHGVNAYSIGNGALKRMLDSALALAYPDAKMTVAALHDSGQLALLGGPEWFTLEEGYAYELGYLRYRDPRYVPIIQGAAKELSLNIHTGGPSRFLDLPKEVPLRSVENANFYVTGYGVQRLETGNGTAQLIFEFGDSMLGHSHPSKLALDFYALNDVVMPFPGVIFPYNDPMDPKWYWTTPANCALTVDEKTQQYAGNWYKFPKGTPKPFARQLVYAPAATMGLQRGSSDTIHPGVTQDRSVFFTPRYLADLFAAFADEPHCYDLAWHLRGQFASDLPLKEMTFPELVAPGYNGLSEVRHAAGDKPWEAAITLSGGQPVRVKAPGETGAEVIVGKGHFFHTGSKKDEEPPTIIERRDGKKNVLFGTVVDFSGDSTGYVKNIVREGSPEAGYGLLRVGTAKGSDLCFAAYRPGAYRAAGLETNGLQAFVSAEGKEVRALYLAGGTVLRTEGAAIERDQPGLAFVEKTPVGGYVVGNPSPADATVTVTLAPLATLKARVINEKGERGGPAEVTSARGAVSIHLKARSKVEFAPADR
ncbi:MAG: alginate lyase family protein [Chthoniobacteraceae bacterium]